MVIERVITIPINMLVQELMTKAGKLTKSNKGAMLLSLKIRILKLLEVE